MKDMKESITLMQKSLNKLMQTEDGANTNASGVYSLSVMLDKEIVKYYKNLRRCAC